VVAEGAASGVVGDAAVRDAVAAWVLAAPDAAAVWAVVVRDAVVVQDVVVARNVAVRAAAAVVLHAAAVAPDAPAARVSAHAGRAPVSDVQHYYAAQQAGRSLIVHCAKRRRPAFLPDALVPDER